MINAFSSNVNTVNLHLKIKFWPLYKTMKDFILKVLAVKRSQKLYNVQFALSDCVDCDLRYECIIRKVNISKKGINWKTSFALMPLH